MQAAAPGHMTHCDKVGDPICMEEARWVLNVVYDALAGQVGPCLHRLLHPGTTWCAQLQQNHAMVAETDLQHAC
jgi:hypothetical protein